MINKLTAKKGYSLVEIVVYVSILAVFFIIIVNSILSFAKPYREILALRVVERSGLDSMERITRDIRSATSVDLANSTLGSSPGVLTLISVSDSVSTTTKFYLDSGVVKVDVNGVYEGPLSASSTSVTNLVFHRLATSTFYAVKIDMTVSAAVGSTTKIKNYHSTIELKAI